MEIPSHTLNPKGNNGLRNYLVELDAQAESTVTDFT